MRWLALALMVGCAAGGNGKEGLTAEEQQALDIEEYESLTAELAERMVEFSGEGPVELSTLGDTLFWLNYHDQWDPKLYAHHGGETHEIALVDGDAPAYRMSSEVVVTAAADFDEVIYSAYQLDGTPLGTNRLPAPDGGIRWYAFAVDGTDLYIVDEAEDAVMKVPAAGGTPERVTTFMELGVEVTWFWDFDVEDGEMLFVESGRLWSADLEAGTATWLGNETEVTSAATTGDYVVFASADGTMVHDRRDGSNAFLKDLVEAAGYDMNETYKDRELPTSGHYSIAGDVVVYEASSSVFAYDLSSQEVEPILLEPRDTLEDYIRPVVTDDGTLYTMGVVDFDTTIWKVEHPFLKP